MTRMARPFRDPADRLAELRARDTAGQPTPLHLFYGHRPSSDRPGAEVFSQWYTRAPFTIGARTYPHAEAWMMAEKARLFGDETIRAKLLDPTITPAAAKALGKRVRGFDDATWNAARYRIVLNGNWAKFAQHPQLRELLLATFPAVLVEASPTDRIWGIGLSAQHPDARQPSRWRGANLLGFALTEVRDALR